MSKAERTRQFIIEQTAPLFNSKGFAGTSLNDLTEKTGLTKGALYGNFRDKEDIALTAFKYAIKKVREVVAGNLGEQRTYKMQLFALLDFYAEYVFNPPIPGGCPLLNAAVETDDQYDGIRRVVVKELIQTVSFIQGLIDRGVKSGEFQKINSKELAYVFFCTIEGAIMFSRAERSEEPMKICVKHCKNLLEKISITKQK